LAQPKNGLSPLSDPSFISPIYDLPSTIEIFKDFNSEVYEIPSIKEFVLGDKSSPNKVMIFRKK